MKVTIIGAGNMGAAFASQLAKAGHDVDIVGRTAEKTEAIAAQTGARAASPSAAQASDIVVLATAYGDAVPALQSAGNLDGKIVIDITNPLTADFMGLTIGHSTSAAEEISAALPQIRLVKGFNTLFAQRLAAGANVADGQTAPVFLAADDAEARDRVADLARSLGFDVIDAGPLKNARYLEPLAGLNIYLGYGAGRGTEIAPTWLPLS